MPVLESPEGYILLRAPSKARGGRPGLKRRGPLSLPSSQWIREFAGRLRDPRERLDHKLITLRSHYPTADPE